MKNEIIDLLKFTQREGIDKLIEFLENSDYFEAPASNEYYNCYPGGLIKYNMRVYKLLLEKNKFFQYNISISSLIICAFLHSIYKVNLYQRSEEEPSRAQLNCLQALCNQYNVEIPEGTTITKKIADVLINSIRDTKKLPEYFGKFEICNYRVLNSLPLGYGEKSLYLASLYIKLLEDEALAIRYYLGYKDLTTHFVNRSNHTRALQMYPLVHLLNTASFEAVHYSILEKSLK